MMAVRGNNRTLLKLLCGHMKARFRRIDARSVTFELASLIQSARSVNKHHRTNVKHAGCVFQNLNSLAMSAFKSSFKTKQTNVKFVGQNSFTTKICACALAAYNHLKSSIVVRITQG